MADLQFSICFWNYDRTNPLLDGRVTVAGAAPDFTILSPVENFPSTFTESPFDVTEMSFSNYMTAYADGRSPYTAKNFLPNVANNVMNASSTSGCP